MRQPNTWHRLLPALLGLYLGLCTAAHAGHDRFPCPPELEPFVEFWIEIFTKHDGTSTIIHDTDDPTIRYETVSTRGMAESERGKFVKSRRRYYARILESLTLKSPERWTEQEKAVAALFPAGCPSRTYLKAAGRIRSQRGIRDQFLEGLIRGGRWKQKVEEILAGHQIPTELGVLPYIESSYNPMARSKAGAVGVWQLTSTAGRKYLRIDRHIDERRDVYASTHAAARYLKDAYAKLASWPLSVTSYNHGVNGMVRAKNELGTSDIGRLIREYEGPYFGFASKNFYAEFLAALEVSRRPEAYFGKLAIEPAESVVHFTLPSPARFSSLSKAFGVTTDELCHLNPALGSRVLQGRYGVPSGVVINVPSGRVGDPHEAFLSLPEAERSAALEPTGYKVRWGDTLIGIARRHRVTVGELQAANGLGRSTRIRAGQRLTIPPPSR